MSSLSLRRRIMNRALVALLAVALVFTMMPLGDRSISHAAEGDLQIHSPVLAVTGTGLIGGAYSEDSVSLEKSYTLEELKSMEGVRGQMYSARKQKTPYTRSYFIADGVSISSLIGDPDVITGEIAFRASDGYFCSFLNGAQVDPGTADAPAGGTEGMPNPGSGRYSYDGFDADEGTEVPTILSWAYQAKEGANGEAPAEKPDQVIDGKPLRLITGQLGVEEGGLGPDSANQQLFNGNDSNGIQTVEIGSPIGKTYSKNKPTVTEPLLTVDGKGYTRADVLLMDYAENSYTYTTKKGTFTDVVRGVPMSVLLNGYADDDVVSFSSADGYPVSATGYTVGQLKDNDYILAYEKGSSAGNMAGIFEGDSNAWGVFNLYGSDENGKPAKMVNSITVTKASGEDYSNSPYKHITNGGQDGSSPYNIDAITGATLTVEGPGVEKSIPVSIRDLEGRNGGIKRGVYTDKRSGSDITRKYEGIDLQYILTKMTSGDNGIKMTSKAKKVQIKNRNRKTIAEFTTDQIASASQTETPILVAYGTATQDESKISPFVFDNGAGADKDLGNEDGCIKLVYNKAVIDGDTNADYTTFGNMAYIYVAEAETPGYKHDKDPYRSADISNYVLTVTGDKIGREVNYTVKDLENMVSYDAEGKPDNTGMGYRDEYSLANSTYWYVNEYEGVQLWKLLLRSGLPASFANDDETIVSSTATDGYAATDKFTTKQVADPNSFGFYEKNPEDPNAADWSHENNEVMRDDDHPKGDLIKKGYPVLVAYGVNGYPYVEKSSQEGYLSGLQNDGGPLRIISGKIKYNHANGSNQAKLLDKILVGDNTYHYSTHKYHDRDVYKSLANDELNVKIYNGSDAEAPLLKDKGYKVGDLEELIYGGDLTATQLSKAKIKDFYGVTKKGNVYSDLYEGVDLQYFLTDVVEIPGYKGTITFGNGTQEISMNLEDVLKATGSNGATGVTGLKPVLAYGKNGSPMVKTKNAEDGYEDEVKLSEENTVTIKNNGGPLQLTFPTVEGNTEISEETLTGITSIRINLSPDKYAHTEAPYDSYKGNTITISGEGTRLAEAKDFTVEELEGKQTIAFTGDYSILKSEGTDVSQSRYRGIDLYALLTSTSVGLKSNADKVKVTTTDGEVKEFTLSEIRKKYVNTATGEENMPVILAYGSGKAGDADKEDGKPLVPEKEDEGYVKAYSNNGGPIRLVVGQTETGDVNSGKNLKFVKSIEVTASEITSWNHSVSEIYKQYLNETVDLQVVNKDGDELFNKSYTVEDIENQTALIEQIDAQTTQNDRWEGINLWSFIKQEAGSISGIDDPITVDVTAADGFGKELRSIFGMDALNDGIKDGTNYVPIILAYGVNGSPLVIGDKTYPNGEGYDATVGNNGGPIRLVTHKNQGASLTYVKKIKITVGESTPEPETADFTIKGLESGDVKLSVDDISKIKNSAGDVIGTAEATYTHKKGTDEVKGIYLDKLLAAYDMVLENAKITLNATDGFEEKEPSYKDITLKDAADQKYFLAYQVKNSEGQWEDISDSDNKDDPEQGKITKVRIYRNYNEALEQEPSVDWRNRCTSITGITLELPEVTKFKEYNTGSVRSTWMDKDNTMWVGTYGGGLSFKKVDEKSWRVLNTKSIPALETEFTSAVAADADGGIWVSQNASYTDPTNNRGVLYIKDGEAKQYTKDDSPQTIPDNYVQAIQVEEDGKVWFGSFGGLTIYNPKAAEGSQWTTYTKEKSGFPATSVNTITLDGNGGAWLGFYPDGKGTVEDPYTGGFCHIDSEGHVTKNNVVRGEMTQDGSTSKLAQAWVRSIAIDNKGTVWVVASGTNLEENEGGTIWKLKNGTEEPTVYTGKIVFADYLDGSKTTEVRIVSVDKEGNLWFGTSADGVLVVSNPKPNDDGTMTVDAQYAAETGSWKGANRNNIYHIDFWNDGTAYVGSAGGLQVLGDEPASSKPSIGEETMDSAALVVDGDGVTKNGLFSIKTLKNAAGIEKVDADYSWMNKSGTTGTNHFQGVYLDNLLDVCGLSDDAYRFTVIASDGYSKTFDLDKIDIEDKDGNKMMIAWQSDEDPDNPKIDPKLVIGQARDNDQNKSSWIGNVVEIRVDLATKTEKEELRQAKEEALRELQDSYNEKDQSLYDEDGQYDLQSAYTEGSESIAGARTKSGVDRTLEEAKAAIEAVKTKEQIREELKVAKEDANEVIDQATTAALETIDIIEDEEVKAEIQGKIDIAVAAAKARISEVKKPENIAAIAAAEIQSINDMVASALEKAEADKKAAEEKALTDAKNQAIQEVMDHLNANSGNGDQGAMTKAALEAIMAITQATDAESIQKAKSAAKGSIDKAVEDKKAADEKAAADAAYKKAVKKAKALKVKKFKVKAKKKKKARLTWAKTKGASGYEIYRATKKNGKYKKVKTLKKASKKKFTNKKLKAKRTYYYKMRPYTLVKNPAGKTIKVYGKYTKVKKVRAKK